MASSPAYPFPPWGYQVVDLHLKPSVIAALLDEAKTRQNDTVFKEVGGKDDDQFRYQSRLVKPTTSAELQLETNVTHVTRCSDRQWVPSVFSYMVSLPGGLEQDPHQDSLKRDFNRARSKHPNGIPSSKIISIMEGTKLKVYEGCFQLIDYSREAPVQIPVGYAIISRGDLIHRGCAYDEVNYRIHCYLQFPDVEWKPDVVSSVVPKAFSCQYCKKLGASSNAIRRTATSARRNPTALRPAPRVTLITKCPVRFSSVASISNLFQV